MGIREIFKAVFAKLNSMFAGAAKSDLLPYPQTRAIYKYQVQNIILGYLIEGSNNTFNYVSDFKKAMGAAFSDAFGRGYIDGGGDPQEMREDDAAWLANKKQTERGFIDQLFTRLKELKKSSKAEDQTQTEYLADVDAEVDARTNGYTNTLDGVYAEGRLRGAGNIMLTFDGDDGEESCKTCRKWKGKRHAASFWIIRGLIPGQPGNQNFECCGYNCKHYLFDDKGEIWAGH